MMNRIRMTNYRLQPLSKLHTNDSGLFSVVEAMAILIRFVPDFDMTDKLDLNMWSRHAAFVHFRIDAGCEVKIRD